MPFIHLERDRWLSPSTPIEIDWSHPLAWGLNCAHVFNLDGGLYSFDLTGIQDAATQTAVTSSAGYTAHGGRRAIHQGAWKYTNCDQVVIPAPKLNDADDPSYANSMAIGANHEGANESNAWLLSAGDSPSGSGGWSMQATSSQMSCQLNSGNGFGVRTLYFTDFADFWTAGKWFDVSLACRYETAQGKHRLYGNFNNGVEEQDDETYNNPNAAGHKDRHQLFMATYFDHYQFKGWCSHVYFWDRRFLTEDERLWINAEPMAFLRPVKVRTYFLPPEPSGGAAASPWFFQHQILQHRRGA